MKTIYKYHQTLTSYLKIEHRKGYSVRIYEYEYDKLVERPRDEFNIPYKPYFERVTHVDRNGELWVMHRGKRLYFKKGKEVGRYV